MTAPHLYDPERPFQAQLEKFRQATDDALSRMLPPADRRPARLHAAMRYSVQAGGKRLRPCLLLAAWAGRTGEIDPLPAAAAIEALHTYSLIHDDLPCMDDSDLRRGRPTCHVAYDEATALLAGDALLTWAFWWIAHAYRSRPGLAAGLLEDLGHAAGSECLIGGQQEDLEGESQVPTPDRLEFIHENKTGALLTTSLTMGARLGGGTEGEIAQMRVAGRHVGLAFQIIDDILDVTSDAAAMGKPVGADAHHAKMTYPSLYGLEISRQKADEHTAAAVDALAALPGDYAFLRALIAHMAERVH